MIVVVDEIKKIVERAASKYGSDITFFHGHVKQIQEELNLMSIRVETREQKYPCIMLLQDFAEQRSSESFVSCRMQLLIVASSYIEYSASTRLEKVFKPVLYPIYESLMYSIQNTPTIVPGTFEHEKIDRLNLTSSFNEAIMSQGGKSIFSDYLDGIEIRNLDLKIDKNC